MLVLIALIILVALTFDFLNGFHDSANSIATVVSTRVLTPAQAVLWAAFFNFVAAFVFGTGVAKAVEKSIIHVERVDIYVILAGLLGACAWNIITWLNGLPTSSSHALLAGYAGAAVSKAGWGVVIWKGWAPIIEWLFLAPMIGLILGALVMIAVAWIFRRVHYRTVDHLFRRVQLFSAGIYSLAHGGNDAQKTMGIIVALLTAGGLEKWGKWGSVPWLHLFGDKSEIGLPIILACNFAMALGTALGGWRIVKTMGTGITKLTPVSGACAEVAAASTIIYATIAKVPLSTTHAITGAILGVGSTNSIRSVRWIWGERIIVAWIITIPCAAALAALAYLLIHFTIEPLMR
jgi:PiT family inorganic phosphate transporter